MEIAFGILGSVASIVGLLLPANGWKQRMIHIVYGVVIICLAYGVVSYQIKIDRILSVERAAARMVRDSTMNYTDLGFVHASLAFLEKNRDLYPDTYIRAQQMCEKYKCYSAEGNSVDMVSLKYAMKGLLTGIATISSDS